MLGLIRRRLFFKFLGLTIVVGVGLSVLVLALYYPYRRQILIGEMSAVIGVTATKLDRALAEQVRDGRLSEARQLLGLFGAFTYTVCADYRQSANAAPVVFWPIPCARMDRPGTTLTIPSAASGAGGYFSVRLSDDEVRAILAREFLVLGSLATATSTAILLAAAAVFMLIINRPLGRLVSAMTRFETENVPEKVDWPTEDEMGRVALRYNAMLDREVERVEELEDAYGIITGSITYAANIQQAILPPREVVQETLGEVLLVWEPRDVVGGDFYWCGRWGEGVLVVLADCTGHGVPGAFMTLIARSALDRARGEVPVGAVGDLLGAVHRHVQRLLGQDEAEGPSDDGLEAVACYLPPDRGTIQVAAARMPAFVVAEGAVRVIKGTKAGMGYRGIPHAQAYAAQEVAVEPGMTVYLSSDGLLDQVGGPRNRMYGKTRFSALLQEIHGLPMDDQDAAIRGALQQWQGAGLRRDDVSVIGFRL